MVCSADVPVIRTQRGSPEGTSEMISSSKEEETGPQLFASGHQNMGSSSSPAAAGCKRAMSDSRPRYKPRFSGFGTSAKEQIRPLGVTIGFMKLHFPEFEEKSAKQGAKEFRNLGIQRLRN